MAEFALIAPMGFLLLMSIVVIGIMVTNYIQVTNVARDGARMAAICAGEDKNNTTTDYIPDGSSPPLQCDVTDLEKYMENHLTAIPGGSVQPSIQVCPAGASSSSCPAPNGGSLPGNCDSQQLIQVQITYPQPLYLPIVSSVFESNSNGTRNLNAAAEAGCE